MASLTTEYTATRLAGYLGEYSNLQTQQSPAVSITHPDFVKAFLFEISRRCGGISRYQPAIYLDYRLLPGGLFALNAWERQPFGKCPDVICQASGHGRSALPPPSVGVSHTECSYRPAEVIAGQGEVGYRFMHLPVLRETVALVYLPGIASTVGPGLPFDKRGVN